MTQELEQAKELLPDIIWLRERPILDQLDKLQKISGKNEGVFPKVNNDLGRTSLVEVDPKAVFEKEGAPRLEPLTAETTKMKINIF